MFRPSDDEPVIVDLVGRAWIVFDAIRTLERVLEPLVMTILPVRASRRSEILAIALVLNTILEYVCAVFSAIVLCISFSIKSTICACFMLVVALMVLQNN